jgi:hypothetical protein
MKKSIKVRFKEIPGHERSQYLVLARLPLVVVGGYDRDLPFALSTVPKML